MPSDFALKPAAGNGIFGCGDRRQKAPIKYVVARGDKEYGKEPAENPRRKAIFDLVLETCGLRRLGGGVRSQIRTGLHLQFPANREINREFRDSGPSEANFVHETTVLQRLFTKFPTQINRENILKNREFLSGNREFRLQGAQASISPTLVLRIAIV